jgi:hypothetical protein
MPGVPPFKPKTNSCYTCAIIVSLVASARTSMLKYTNFALPLSLVVCIVFLLYIRMLYNSSSKNERYFLRIL